MQLLDGKATSEQLKAEIAEKVAVIKAADGKVPHLAAVIVGNDGGSHTYVNNKVRTCEQLGFDSTLITLPEECTEEELLQDSDMYDQQQPMQINSPEPFIL